MISHFRWQNAVGNRQKAVNFVLNSDGTKSAIGKSICSVENKEKEYTISDGLNVVGNNVLFFLHFRWNKDYFRRHLGRRKCGIIVLLISDGIEIVVENGTFSDGN